MLFNSFNVSLFLYSLLNLLLCIISEDPTYIYRNYTFQYDDYEGNFTSTFEDFPYYAIKENSTLTIVVYITPPKELNSTVEFFFQYDSNDNNTINQINQTISFTNFTYPNSIPFQFITYDNDHTVDNVTAYQSVEYIRTFNSSQLKEIYATHLYNGEKGYIYNHRAYSFGLYADYYIYQRFIIINKIKAHLDNTYIKKYSLNNDYILIINKYSLETINKTNTKIVEYTPIFVSAENLSLTKNGHLYKKVSQNEESVLLNLTIASDKCYTKENNSCQSSESDYIDKFSIETVSKSINISNISQIGNSSSSTNIIVTSYFTESTKKIQYFDNKNEIIFILDEPTSQITDTNFPPLLLDKYYRNDNLYKINHQIGLSTLSNSPKANGYSFSFQDVGKILFYHTQSLTKDSKIKAYIYMYTPDNSIIYKNQIIKEPSIISIKRIYSFSLSDNIVLFSVTFYVPKKNKLTIQTYVDNASAVSSINLDTKSPSIDVTYTIQLKFKSCMNDENNYCNGNLCFNNEICKIALNAIIDFKDINLTQQFFNFSSTNTDVIVENYNLIQTNNITNKKASFSLNEYYTGSTFSFQLKNLPDRIEEPQLISNFYQCKLSNTKECICEIDLYKLFPNNNNNEYTFYVNAQKMDKQYYTITFSDNDEIIRCINISMNRTIETVYQIDSENNKYSFKYNKTVLVDLSSIPLIDIQVPDRTQIQLIDYAHPKELPIDIEPLDESTTCSIYNMNKTDKVEGSLSEMIKGKQYILTLAVKDSFFSGGIHFRIICIKNETDNTIIGIKNFMIYAVSFISAQLISTITNITNDNNAFDVMKFDFLDLVQNKAFPYNIYRGDDTFTYNATISFQKASEQAYKCYFVSSSSCNMQCKLNDSDIQIITRNSTFNVSCLYSFYNNLKANEGQCTDDCLSIKCEIEQSSYNFTFPIKTCFNNIPTIEFKNNAHPIGNDIIIAPFISYSNYIDTFIHRYAINDNGCNYHIENTTIHCDTNTNDEYLQILDLYHRESSLPFTYINEEKTADIVEYSFEIGIRTKINITNNTFEEKQCTIINYPHVNENCNYDNEFPIPIRKNNTIIWNIAQDTRIDAQSMLLKCNDISYPNTTINLNFSYKSILNHSFKANYYPLQYANNNDTAEILIKQCYNEFNVTKNNECTKLLSPYQENITLVKRQFLQENHQNNSLRKGLIYYINKAYFSYMEYNNITNGYYRFFKQNQPSFNVYSVYYNNTIAHPLSVIDDFKNSLPYYINITDTQADMVNNVINTFMNPVLIPFEKTVFLINYSLNKAYYFINPKNHTINANFYNSYTIDNHIIELQFNQELSTKKIDFNSTPFDLVHNNLTKNKFFFQNQENFEIKENKIYNLQLQIHNGYPTIDSNGSFNIRNNFVDFPLMNKTHQYDILLDYNDPSFIFENDSFANEVSERQLYFGHFTVTPFSDFNVSIILRNNSQNEMLQNTRKTIIERGREYKNITLYRRYPIFLNLSNQQYPNQMKVTFSTDYHQKQLANLNLISYLPVINNKALSIDVKPDEKYQNNSNSKEIFINYINVSSLIRLGVPYSKEPGNIYAINTENVENNSNIEFSIEEIYHLHKYNFTHISINEIIRETIEVIDEATAGRFNITKTIRFIFNYQYITNFEFDTGLFYIHFHQNDLYYNEVSLIPEIKRINSEPKFEILVYQINPFTQLAKEKKYSISMNQYYLIYVSYKNEFYPYSLLPLYYNNNTNVWPPLYNISVTSDYKNTLLFDIRDNIISFKLTHNNIIDDSSQFNVTITIENIITNPANNDNNISFVKSETITFTIAQTEISLQSNIDYSLYNTYNQFDVTRYIRDFESENKMYYTLFNPLSEYTGLEVSSSCLNFKMNSSYDSTIKEVLISTEISEHQITSGECSIDIKKDKTILKSYNYTFCQNLLCNIRQEYKQVKCESNNALNAVVSKEKKGQVMYDSFPITNNTVIKTFIGIDFFIWENNSNDYNGGQKYVESLPCIPDSIFKDKKPILNQKVIYIMDTVNEISLFGDNFRQSCYCYYDNGTEAKFVLANLISNQIIHCNITEFTKQQFKVDIRCVDHGSFLLSGSNNEIGTDNNALIYKSENTVTVNIDFVHIVSITFKQKRTGLFVSAEKVHNHGGYEAKVTLDKPPKCISEQECSLSDFVFNINGYIINHFDYSTDNKNYYILIPPLKENYTSANISFSFDRGQSFSHPISFNLSGICNHTYCEDYEQKNITKGHFCDIVPKKTTDKYCHTERPCLPGTYTNFDNGTYTCKKVPRGYYLNFWGADYSFIQPKPCPQGFICTEEGLPKYYEICPPGRKCLNEAMYQYTKNKMYYTDYFKNQRTDIKEVNCQERNYCKLGVLRDKSYINFSIEYETLNSNDLVKYLNKMYSIKKAFEFSIENNYIKDLSVRECERQTGCSSQHEFYDRSTELSNKGYYTAQNCTDPTWFNITRSVPFIKHYNKWIITNPITSKKERLFSYTDNDISINLTLHENETAFCSVPHNYANQSCNIETIQLNPDQCCSVNTCICPRGCKCEEENLIELKLCSAGTFRYNSGFNSFSSIYLKYGIDFLDFLNPETPIYHFYRNKFNITLKYDINDYKDNTECILCPPGYYCEEGCSEPKICSKGTYCPMMSSNELQCGMGYYNPYKGQYECLPCPYGMMCHTAGATNYTVCKKGYYCDNDKIGGYQNDANENTAGDYNFAKICPDGYYCPEGTTKPIACKEGQKCSKGSSTYSLCPAGTFNSKQHQTECVDCPIGYYCPTQGMTEPLPCPEGKICSSTRAVSSGMNCDAGKYCPGLVAFLNEEWMIGNKSMIHPEYPVNWARECPQGVYCLAGTGTEEPILGNPASSQNCSSGYYNNQFGKTSCSKCDKGHECPIDGLKRPVPCKKGTYSDKEGMISCIKCPKGTYGCNETSTKEEECEKCPAGVVCYVDGLSIDDFAFVDPNKWDFCPEGYTCDEGTSNEDMNKIVCPQSKYCPPGSVSSANDTGYLCPSGRICENGTSLASPLAVSYCSFDDPFYCNIGDLCEKDKFCPEGLNSTKDNNDCSPLVSEKGTREKFLCYRDADFWNMSGILDSNYNTNYSETYENIIKYSEKCIENITIKPNEKQYVSFDLSEKYGFPPDHYNIAFSVKSSRREYLFYLFENNYYGGFDEIPLMKTLSFMLTQTDYKFTIMLYAQEEVNITISIIHYKTPFYNEIISERLSQFKCSEHVYINTSLSSSKKENEGKDLIHFFSLDRNLFTQKVTAPTNMMFIEDYKSNSTVNLNELAISMYYPTILSSSDYKRIQTLNESNFNSTKDYFIYSSNQIALPQIDSLITKEINFTDVFGFNDNSTLNKDRFALSYIPFISNCDKLGSHISFKSLLEFPENCSLVSINDTETFSIQNIFTKPKNDFCNYHTYCFYDEQLSSQINPNWFQYDYSTNNEPIFNISKYALNSDLYTTYIKDYYMNMPNEKTSPKEFSYLYETVPIYAEISKNNLKGKKLNSYVPLDITLELLYYNKGKTRMIIKGNMIFDKFEEIPDSKTIDELYEKRFITNGNNDTVNSSFFDFFKTEIEYSFLGIISRYFFFSNYNKTTQFKNNFTNYYNYRTRNYYNTTNDNQNFSISASNITFNSSFDQAELSQYISNISQLNFILKDSTVTYDKPPSVTLDAIETEKQLGDYSYQYKEYYSGYKLKAYMLSISTYRFNVIIRPLTWAEALLNHAFPTYTYIALALFGMGVLSLNYVTYNLSFKLAIMRKFFNIKHNQINEDEVIKKLFYESYHKFYLGKNLKLLGELLINNGIAFIFVGLPSIAVMLIILIIIKYSEFISNISIDISQISYDKTSEIRTMNTTGRYSFIIIVIGMVILYKGLDLIKADFPKEIREDKYYISEDDKKSVNASHFSLILKILSIMLLLLIFIIFLSNYFNKILLVSAVFYLFYDVILTEFIKGLFYFTNELTYSVISISLHLLIIDILFCNSDINILLIVYPIAILTNFIKFIYQEQIQQLISFIYSKLKILSLKANDKANGDEGSYSPIINKNMQILIDVSIRITLGIITVILIAIKLTLMCIVFYSNENEFTYTYVFLCLALGQVVCDLINSYLIINANSTSNINCDLISIFCECKCIFYRRNASWATNSSESIHEKEYRQYQHRYDMIIKLGFSSQLFIIFYIFSFGFYFIYLGLNYIISNEVYPWLDPIMIVIIFVLVLGGIGLFIAMSVIKRNKEFWPSTELDKNRKLIVNKLRENKEKEVTKQTEMGIHNVIADMFMLIRPEITEIMMNDGISGEEKIEKVNELFNHYNGYQVVHQAKRREINELFVEEFERRKKERANYIKGNTNKYDYFIPNLSEYLKLSNYRKYQFESKINASLEEENPFVDLSNEVSVIIGTLNPKVRNIPETFIKDVVCNVDLDKQITKKTFSRRRKKNNM